MGFWGWALIYLVSTQPGKLGCYLGTQAENARAIRFFEKSGFTKHGPTPLIPGSRFRGEQVHQQLMVWSVAG